jgi:Ubiquitin carboxyl-terminal hydrolase
MDTIRHSQHALEKFSTSLEYKGERINLFIKKICRFSQATFAYCFLVFLKNLKLACRKTSKLFVCHSIRIKKTHFSRKKQFDRYSFVVKNPTIKPVYFYNEDNKCWLHACLQILAATEKKEWMKKEYQRFPKRLVTKALNQLDLAISSGSLRKVDAASKKMHKAVSSKKRKNRHIDLMYKRYEQKDAAFFFETALPDLDYSIMHETIRSGQIGNKQCFSTSCSSASLLQINLTEGLKTLQETIDEYFKQYVVKGDTWRYEDSVVPSYSIKNRIRPLNDHPEFLFIHLIRFRALENSSLETNEKTLSKIETRLEFLPDENGRYIIDFSTAFGMKNALTKKIKKTSSTLYELFGLVHHEGSLENGHYTADVLRTDPNTQKKQWYFCDDVKRVVKTISPQKVRAGDAYIMAFKQIPLDTSQEKKSEI